MLSIAKHKLIQSLSKKKYRDKHKLFIAEGEKLIHDLIDSKFPIHAIIGDINLLNKKLISDTEIELIEASLDQMKKASFLKTPSKILALCKITPVDIADLSTIGKITLVLDDIQDPGNMGTIIRLADWFGIEQIVCSNNTVDVYNPKVIQATMGAIARVKITYNDIENFILTEKAKSSIKVYGTFMEGENIYEQNLPSEAIVIMGNEGNGISQNIEKLVTNKIHIPSFTGHLPTSESLNVSTATAITLSEFKRGQITKQKT